MWVGGWVCVWGKGGGGGLGQFADLKGEGLGKKDEGAVFEERLTTQCTLCKNSYRLYIDS